MIRIRHPFFLCCLLLAAVFSDGSGIALDCILAALLHESGHLLAYGLLLHRLPTVQIGITGMVLPWRSMQTGGWKEAWILMAGPLANLLGLFAALCLLRQSMQLRTAAFASANLFLAVFNLLPLRFLDGGRLLELVLRKCSAPAAERILFTAQAASFFALAALFFIVPGTFLSKMSIFCCIIYCFAKSFYGRN